MPQLKANPDWLRVTLPSSAIGVDRDNRTIRGFLVAEEGPFQSEGRGEFDADAIRTIRELMSRERLGLKSRFSHPNISDDGLGKFLGRAQHPREVDVYRDGVPRLAVRADLVLSDTAFETNPNGNLGEYILDLAEEDPDALGASLVLRTDKELRRDEKGRPLKGDDGQDLLPLWRPKVLHAIDVVDTGDATRAFLSVDGLPDGIVRTGTLLLDRQFPNDDAEVIRARCMGYLNRYLSNRFGEPDLPAGGDPEVSRLRLGRKFPTLLDDGD